MTKTGQDNNLNYVDFLRHFYQVHAKKNKVQRRNMPHFEALNLLLLLLLPHSLSVTYRA